MKYTTITIEYDDTNNTHILSPTTDNNNTHKTHNHHQQNKMT